MSYIDLREHAEGHDILKTLQKIMTNACSTAEIGHPTDEYIKNIISQLSLKNIPIRVSDIANAKLVFGPFDAGLKRWKTRKKGVPGR